MLAVSRKIIHPTHLSNTSIRFPTFPRLPYIPPFPIIFFFHRQVMRGEKITSLSGWLSDDGSRPRKGSGQHQQQMQQMQGIVSDERGATEGVLSYASLFTSLLICLCQPLTFFPSASLIFMDVALCLFVCLSLSLCCCLFTILY